MRTEFKLVGGPCPYCRFRLSVVYIGDGYYVQLPCADPICGCVPGDGTKIMGPRGAVLLDRFRRDDRSWGWRGHDEEPPSPPICDDCLRAHA